jgi:beta-ribofuranosylaminobenzene 5'-phosphate synthase
MPTALQIRSNGRLHFGLMEISHGEPNCFAGIGLMVQHSFGKMEVSIGNASNASFERIDNESESYWMPRLLPILDRWNADWGAVPFQSTRILEAPVAHCGLGSGTQMACTFVAALMAANHVSRSDAATSESCRHLVDLLHSMSMREEDKEAPPRERARRVLSRLSCRGTRSHIGLAGFLEGGFVVDLGKSEACRTMRLDFPKQWPILILNDRSFVGDFGFREVEMFEACSQYANPSRSTMLQLVMDRIVPSIQSHDWDTFDRSLGDYGRLAGSIFSSVQGGLFRSPRIEEVVTFANRIGIRGAVQSSWGPSTCIVARNEDHAQWCNQALLKAFPEVSIHTTFAANEPAQLVVGSCDE